MKTYTNKSNAKRAAKKITEELSNRIEDVSVVAVEGGFAVSVLLNEQNNKADYEAIKDQHPNFNITWIEPKAAPVATELKEATPIKRKSDISSPCTAVWNIADEMVGARRKDVIAACVEAGIAFYTARTQYQLWKQANKA